MSGVPATAPHRGCRIGVRQDEGRRAPRSESGETILRRQDGCGVQRGRFFGFAQNDNLVVLEDVTRVCSCRGPARAPPWVPASAGKTREQVNSSAAKVGFRRGRQIHEEMPI